MRPVLEYASSTWSHLASSTSINKLQGMQNAALRTATGCTQDTNIQHLHDDTYTSHTQAPTAPRITIQTENTTSITSHPLHKHTTYFNTPRLKITIFNNGRYTTNIRHIHTSIVSRHLATRGNKKYCAHLHHTLAALKRYYQPHLSHHCPTQNK